MCVYCTVGASVESHEALYIMYGLNFDLTICVCVITLYIIFNLTL